MWEILQSTVKLSPPLLTHLETSGSTFVHMLISTKQVKRSGFGRDSQVEQASNNDFIPFQIPFITEPAGNECQDSHALVARLSCMNVDPVRIKPLTGILPSRFQQGDNLETLLG